MPALIPGKLYKCTSFCLLIYPTREKACLAPVTCTIGVTPQGRANYWSKRLNCTVKYTNPEDVLCFLKEEKEKADDRRFCQFLVSDFTGWIICQDWLEFVRV